MDFRTENFVFLKNVFFKFMITFNISTQKYIR